MPFHLNRFPAYFLFIGFNGNYLLTLFGFSHWLSPLSGVSTALSVSVQPSSLRVPPPILKLIWVISNHFINVALSFCMFFAKVAMVDTDFTIVAKCFWTQVKLIPVNERKVMLLAQGYAFDFVIPTLPDLRFPFKGANIVVPDFTIKRGGTRWTFGLY